MTRKDPETTRRLVLAAGDWLVSAGSALLAYEVRFRSGWIEAPKGAPPFESFVGVTVLMACLWVWAFHWAGVYTRRHSNSLIDEAYKLFVGIGAGAVALGALTFLLQAFWYSRLVLGLTVVFSAVLLPAWHVLERRAASRLHARGLGRQRVALVGANLAGATVAAKLRQLGPSHQFIGYLDAGEEEPESDSAQPLLGKTADVCELVEEHRLDEIWVPPGTLTQAAALRLVSEADKTDTRLRFLPDLLDLVKHRGVLESYHDLQLLTVHYVRLTGWKKVAKRLLDLVGGLVLLVLFAPLMLAAAVAIRLSSKGPILYQQERVGLNGQPFMMLKFRSMRPDAEVDTGPVWATDDDPRRTRVGAFLRRTSLDETPQFFNILKGEMSLVGPRPERPHFVEQFRQRLPRYDERHRVKGGITGWAQVHGLRGNSSLVARTLYDLHYVENWSLALDVEILVKTAFEVLFHRGAY